MQRRILSIESPPWWPGRRSPWVRAALQILTMITPLVLAFAVGCSDAGGPTEPNGPTGPVQVGSVTVSPAAGTLEVGAQLQLTAILRSATGDTLTGRTITWLSSDTAVAKVSTSGGVSAAGAGSATITARSGGRSGQATITVNATVPEPVIGALEPASVAAGLPGFTLKITGTGFIEGSRLQWNGTARPSEYVSPTELRATIFEGDIAAAGTARIQVVNAVPGGRGSNGVDFPILAQTVPVASVELSTTIAITGIGQPVPLAVTLRDGAGNVLTGRLVTWQSSNALVATVNGAGVVSPSGEGEATITATSEGRTATLALTVSRRPYHLVFDEAGKLAYHDMRLGGAPRVFWEHGVPVRALDAHVSPDHFFYVYVVQTQSRVDIAVLDIVSRTYWFLTSDGVSDQPEWSPSGDRIVFRSSRSGRSDIWTVLPDGSGAVNVTAGMPQGWESKHPTWSPTGQSIAFSSGPAGSPERLHIVRTDGTYVQSVNTGADRALEPSWKGDVIVFTARDQFGRSDIWRTSVSGISPLMRLTWSNRASTPAWSPDGRWIAFGLSKSAGTPGSIMAIRPTGEDARPILHFADPSQGGFRPAWVPF